MPESSGRLSCVADCQDTSADPFSRLIRCCCPMTCSAHLLCTYTDSRKCGDIKKKKKVAFSYLHCLKRMIYLFIFFCLGACVLFACHYLYAFLSMECTLLCKTCIRVTACVCVCDYVCMWACVHTYKLRRERVASARCVSAAVCSQQLEVTRRKASSTPFACLSHAISVGMLMPSMNSVCPLC